MASFQWGAAECFTVMDVPHRDPVSDAFGARGVGCQGVSQCHTAKMYLWLSERFIHLGRRGGQSDEMSGVIPPESFYFCSLCSKECSE